MTTKLERILLSILLGISVLLGLSFWLNIIYGFNVFYSKHWEELSRLQAEQTQISTSFYISFGIAILIFIIGLLFIYVPHLKTEKSATKPKSVQPEPVQSQPLPKTETQPQKTEQQSATVVTTAPNSNMPLTRPPKLNLPSNMAQIVAQKYQQQNKPTPQVAQANTSNVSENPYTQMISQIFTENGYTVKTNPKISGFTPNLFAIAPNEMLWIGSVDQDISKLQSAVDKLKSLFEETLEDIEININAFMLDTMDKYPENDSIVIFKSIDQLKEFISNLPVSIDEDDTLDKSNFDAYSEYIDTIVQYLKSTGS